jgi:hypothetical protein
LKSSTFLLWSKVRNIQSLFIDNNELKVNWSRRRKQDFCTSEIQKSEKVPKSTKSTEKYQEVLLLGSSEVSRSRSSGGFKGEARGAIASIPKDFFRFSSVRKALEQSSKHVFWPKSPSFMKILHPPLSRSTEVCSLLLGTDAGSNGPQENSYLRNLFYHTHFIPFVFSRWSKHPNTEFNLSLSLFYNWNMTGLFKQLICVVLFLRFTKPFFS